MTAPGFRVLFAVFISSWLTLPHPQLWPLPTCHTSYSQHSFQIVPWINPYSDLLGSPPSSFALPLCQPPCLAAGGMAISYLSVFVPRVLPPSLPLPVPILALLLLSFWNVHPAPRLFPTCNICLLSHASLERQATKASRLLVGQSLWPLGLWSLVAVATLHGPWEPGW